MKEIKFRAWNIATKTMIDLKKVTPFALDMDTDGLFIPFSDGLILMQYIGLKDKEGREIYEGDIIRNEDRGIQLIEFIPPCFRSKLYPTLYHRDWEVMGNIYENPELLEKP